MIDVVAGAVCRMAGARGWLPIGLVVVAGASACAGQAADAGSTATARPASAAERASATPEPSPVASQSAAPTPFDHGEIPPELVGTWAFEVFDKPARIELTADGRFSMRYTSVPGAVSGSFGIFGDESIWRDESGDVCHPAEARYGWELEGDVLTLTPLDDRCTSGRIAEWSSGWTRTNE